MNKAYIDILTPCIILTIFLLIAGTLLIGFNDSDELFKFGKTMVYLSVAIIVVVTITCLIIGAVVK